MSNPLSVALTSLMSTQQEMANLGHNVANSSNPAYSRQVMDKATNAPQRSGNAFIGSGIQITANNRVSDEALNTLLQHNTSGSHLWQTYATIANRVEQLVADQDTSLAQGINQFFAALNTLTINPGSIESRQTLIGQASVLVNKFNTLDTLLNEQMADLQTQKKQIIGKINQLSQSLVEINNNIATIYVNKHSPMPNDLLDQRDFMIRQLAELVDVNTVTRDDNRVNVLIGANQALVLGEFSYTLGTRPDALDASISDVVTEGVAGYQVVTSAMSGGQLGAVQLAQTELMMPLRSTLGRIALTLGMQFNEQHQLGVDLQGNLGQMFFADLNNTVIKQARVVANPNNTGDASFALSISTDTSALTNSQYSVDYDGALYTLRRLSDNRIISQGNSPNLAGDSLSLQLSSGLMAAGDQFILTPTRNAGQTMALRPLLAAADIAMASPIRPQTGLSNRGSGSIDIINVTNTSGVPAPTATRLGNAFSAAGRLSPPVQINFLDENTYAVFDISTGQPGVQLGPNQIYDPLLGGLVFPLNNVFDLGTASNYNYDPGYQVQIKGRPQGGDAFTVDYNADGFGSNFNGLQLLAVQTKKLMTGNTATLNEVYDQQVSDVGTIVNRSEQNLGSADTLLRISEKAREQLSGVNMDEEAASLVRLQQLYQASAQVIRASQNMFEILTQSLLR